MSAFTRTTTPPFSANPLQAFVTYKQARRAAKGGAVIAFVFAGLSAIQLIPYLAASDRLPGERLGGIIGTAVIVTVLWVLGWRIWVKSGPWKVLPVLVITVVNVLTVLFRPSIPGVIIAGVMLDFAVIAYRGALAMKRLQGHAQIQADIDVF
jgi:hypothetical protein